MQYQDNNYKFVVVMNKKIEVGRLLNAFGHIIAGLTSLVDKNEIEFLKYVDADGSLHPAICRYPVVVLAARNGNQIRTLRNAAIETGILYNDFVDKMIGSSADEQIQQTRETKENDFEYYGIALFGKSETLNPLTKKFSLFNLIPPS